VERQREGARVIEERIDHIDENGGRKPRPRASSPWEDPDWEPPPFWDIPARPISSPPLHYQRRWEDKDLQNLKELIRLTINWMDNSLLTRKYHDDMPDNGDTARRCQCKRFQGDTSMEFYGLVCVAYVQVGRPG